jgi:hypothetical protein
MDRQAQERLTPWKAAEQMPLRQVSFLVHLLTSSMPLLVRFHFILGTPNVEFLVKVSMLELYNEEICDLLSNDSGKLQIHEDKDKGIYVKELSMETVSTVD